MTRDEIPSYWRQLAALALQSGASHAVPFIIADIVFDSRTLLKCMFGCADWGKGLTCPSRAGSPSMREYMEMFSRYSWGLVIHAGDKHASQKASFALESAAFHNGYYMAFSLSDCGLCAECAGHTGGECRDPRKARPAFHSVGIDVFKTVRAFGMPIETLPDSETQPQNWYSAVFIE
jgi:predicted metal-binding protein